MKFKLFLSILSVSVGLLFLGGSMEIAAHAGQQNIRGEPGRMADSIPDQRNALDLPPAVRNGLNQTMREHLEALEAIVSALARGDYKQGAEIAHEALGFPKHHEAMERERGANFPKRYQDLAIDHHQKAEELAKAISSKEMKNIFSALDQTIKACNACHRTFKQ
jgi:hypothetical protein